VAETGSAVEAKERPFDINITARGIFVGDTGESGVVQRPAVGFATSLTRALRMLLINRMRQI
jgi:hypothetical protein